MGFESGSISNFRYYWFRCDIFVIANTVQLMGMLTLRLGIFFWGTQCVGRRGHGGVICIFYLSGKIRILSTSVPSMRNFIYFIDASGDLDL